MRFNDQMQCVALVEDDGPLRMLLSRHIRQSGFSIRCFGSAAEFRVSAAEQDFDLVILDIMLPNTSGLDICRWLRQRSNVPIIFISARSSHTDRIVGLELGADDYLVKPVDPGELVARMRSVLRRSEGGGSSEDGQSGMVRFDDWRIDQRRRELYAPDGSRVSVSEAEFDLLCVLSDMPQRVVGRELLIEQTRDRLSGRNGTDRSIDVLVSRLRRKLGAFEGGRELIRTVRGVGYVFTPSVER